MKVEVIVLGSVPNKPTVSVDVKQHFNNKPAGCPSTVVMETKHVPGLFSKTHDQSCGVCTCSSVHDRVMFLLLMFFYFARLSVRTNVIFCYSACLRRGGTWIKSMGSVKSVCG